MLCLRAELHTIARTLSCTTSAHNDAGLRAIDWGTERIRVSVNKTLKCIERKKKQFMNLLQDL